MTLPLSWSSLVVVVVARSSVSIVVVVVVVVEIMRTTLDLTPRFKRLLEWCDNLTPGTHILCHAAMIHSTTRISTFHRKVAVKSWAPTFHATFR